MEGRPESEWFRNSSVIAKRSCLHVGDGVLKLQSQNAAHFDGIHAQNIGLQ